MTAGPRKREVFANPFFVVCLATSVAFAVTALAYYVSGLALEPGPGRPPPSTRSREIAIWFDGNAPWVLAAEFGVMLVTGVVAMATDSWFSPRSKPKPPA